MADKKISELTNYTPPIDADVVPIVDSTTGTTKKLTWANLKATIKTYYDSLTATLTNKTIDADNNTITCIDYEAKESKFDIVDMESDGFREATKDVKNSFIFKVVSDHFEPHTVTKERAKSLIFNVINDIISLIYNKVNA